MKAEIILDDAAPLPVEIDARDRRAFEVLGRKQLGIAASLTMTELVKVNPETYVLWLAWNALRRQKLLDITYAELDSRTIEVRQLDDAELLPDPTRATP
jgi:hypothetical protein